MAPKENAAFVAAMEDVLEVYHRRYDEKRPVQLPGEKREPEPVSEQYNRREDAD
jgi:hypothetical protein